MEGVSDSDTVKTLTAKDARLLPQRGVHAGAIAYGADRGSPVKKGAREFLLESLDLALKVLVIICFSKAIIDVARLWLDQRADKRRPKVLRICPNCYNPLPQRNAIRCPSCRVELTPDSRVLIITSPPQPESDRYSPARGEPIHRAPAQQPVREDATREERPKARGFDRPMHPESVRPEPAPNAQVPVEPIPEEPLLEGPQEWEGEGWQEEAWDIDDSEREERAKRRKELLYAIVIANAVGWVAAAVLLLLHLL